MLPRPQCGLIIVLKGIKNKCSYYCTMIIHLLQSNYIDLPAMHLKYPHLFGDTGRGVARAFSGHLVDGTCMAFHLGRGVVSGSVKLFS